MNVEITKLTDVKLLQRANSFTTGRDSHMTLAKAYRAGHSPIRTQLFWVECTDIPLFVASQLVRSHVGVQFFQRSKRTDRGGEDFRSVCYNLSQDFNDAFCMGDEEDLGKCIETAKTLPQRFDRYASTDIAFIINAESLINMAHKRLCEKASAETRDLMTKIALEIAIIDPELAEHLVPQCVFRGGLCTEPKTCGWIYGVVGQAVLTSYVDTLNEVKSQKQQKTTNQKK